MCGGSGPLDDLGNIAFDFFGGIDEMLTNDQAEKAAEREIKNETERLDKIRTKKKLQTDTNVSRSKQEEKRNVNRARQKSKQETGRKGTILTDELGESAGDIAGTVGGKDLLGL